MSNTGKVYGKGARGSCPSCHRQATGEHAAWCSRGKPSVPTARTKADLISPTLVAQAKLPNPKVAVIPYTWNQAQASVLLASLQAQGHQDVVLVRGEDVQLVGFDVVWPPPMQTITVPAMEPEKRDEVMRQLEALGPGVIVEPTTSKAPENEKAGDALHASDVAEFAPPQPGDRVICIEAYDGLHLRSGAEYTVDKVSNCGHLQLRERTGIWFHPKRFVIGRAPSSARTVERTPLSVDAIGTELRVVKEFGNYDVGDIVVLIEVERGQMSDGNPPIKVRRQGDRLTTRDDRGCAQYWFERVEQGASR